MMKQPERIIVVQASSLHKSPEEVASTGEPQITSGSCVLRRPEIADLVQNALLHFNNRRYILSAWCVMPNHAHVVITPLRGNLLADILHSWKSFTASQINKVLHRRGPLWERESFDHLIRTVGDWEKYIVYTENNPVIAGFCVQPEEWPFSSCGAGFPPAQQRSRAAMDAGRMPAPQSNHSDMDTGFQPAQQKGCSGGDASKMPAPQNDLEFLDPRKTPFVALRSRGELPHLYKDGCTYFVTFRQFDAVRITEYAGKMPAPQL